MQLSAPKPVLHYRNAVEDRLSVKDEFWERLADVLVPLVVWGFFVALVFVCVGAVVLWGVLISQAA